MKTFTVTPFLVAFFIAIVDMPTHVYQICAWNLGTLKVDPWRSRASQAIHRATNRFRTWCEHLWRPEVALGALAVLALVAIAVSPAHATAGALLAVGPAAGAADPSFAEVKTAIEGQNRAFEEFKRTNDQRIDQLQKNRVVDPLIEEKLTKINAELDKHAQIVDAFGKLEARMNRFQLVGGNGDETKKLETEVRAFNGILRATALKTGRQAPAELSAEDYKAYKAALNKYIRRGENDLEPQERKAMQVGSDPDGGYVVNPDMSGAAAVKIFETSPIRQIASVQQISTDALEGLRDTDEASGNWVSETGTRSTTNTPVIGKWRIPVQEVYANPGATQTLLDDANIDIEAWLMAKVADKLARLQNTAFVVGTGVGQPRGFASYTTAATADASRAWGTPEHVATGTSGGFGTDPNGSDKLIDLVHKLNSNYRQGAVFVMNRRTLGTARKLKDSSGGAGQGSYIWLPSLAAGQLSTLLGYPVTEADDMTDLGANSLSIAFGNFKIGYQIVDRIGIRVLRDPYTNKPYIQFYTTARVGGDIVHFDAIKFLKFI